MGHHVKSNCSCIIINVYAACNPTEKVALWEDVSVIRSFHQDKVWCCCGDFNAVRCATKRKGIRRNASNKKEIRDFNEFIGSNSMEDLPLVGKKFTWFKADGSAKSRLDRILVSEEWLQVWPMSKKYIQTREVSYHCAIVVKSWSKDWGPKPFKSIDAWLLELGFKDLVRGKWGSYEVQGDNITKVKEKLKLLKLDLKEWNRSVFGNLEDEKRRILKEIEDIDVKDGVSDLVEGEKLRRLELVSQQKLVEKKMESLYRQKARSNWFKYGDSNSKFYHTTIRWRRIKNEVKGVELNNQWCEEPVAVRREVKRVFEERFKVTLDLGVRLGAVEFRYLPEEVSLRMIEVFSEEEVREAVWNCEGTKSPGPDGFNFNFIKAYWETLKEDVMGAVHSFHETGILPKGCNASFIALVPKVKDPTTIDQYRPISLVGAMYKIISKVMSNRIKIVLPMVIDENQSAFMKGRGLLESVLLANEVIEDVRRRRRRGVFLKVDFEKAYDSVRWSFLLDMLNRLGFHERWIKWVQGYLESTTVSILVNGCPTEEFRPTRGLRQGDPMAPFLFLVVAEGLAGLVHSSSKENLLREVKVGEK